MFDALCILNTGVFYNQTTKNYSKLIHENI